MQVSNRSLGSWVLVCCFLRLIFRKLEHKMEQLAVELVLQVVLCCKMRTWQAKTACLLHDYPCPRGLIFLESELQMSEISLSTGQMLWGRTSFLRNFFCCCYSSLLLLSWWWHFFSPVSPFTETCLSVWFHLWVLKWPFIKIPCHCCLEWPLWDTTSF